MGRLASVRSYGWHTAHLPIRLATARLVAMSTEPETQASARGAIPVDSFANRLMLARATADHLSIREAADLCDIGRGAWTNWEKGARPVDLIECATVIADKLGVDKEWLIFGGTLAPAGPRRQLRRGRVTLPGEANSLNPALTRLPHAAIVSSADMPFRPAARRPGGSKHRRPASAIPANRRRPVWINRRSPAA